MFVCLGSTTSTQHTLGKMEWALNNIQTNHLQCGTVSLGVQWYIAILQETFSLGKASVRISDHAYHLRITKIEGMSDVYETHCVSLDGLLILTEGWGWRFCKCYVIVPFHINVFWRGKLGNLENCYFCKSWIFYFKNLKFFYHFISIKSQVDLLLTSPVLNLALIHCWAYFYCIKEQRVCNSVSTFLNTWNIYNRTHYWTCVVKYLTRISDKPDQQLLYWLRFLFVFSVFQGKYYVPWDSLHITIPSYNARSYFIQQLVEHFTMIE